jgi:putative ABC transport system ATP-binding protein
VSTQPHTSTADLMPIPDPPPTTAYELRDVSKIYGSGDRRVIAVNGVSLTVQSGEFLAIVGASGSGKTTLLQLLGALDRPTSGQILCAGDDLSTLSERDLSRLRRDEIGFIFQQFNLIPTLTAEQNVEAAMAATGSSSGERRARARDLLQKVGLAHRTRHLPSQLSGGEQQRVAIARALTNHPSVLLADEPTGNLDTTTGEEILELLRSISASQGQTVILITHDGAIAQTALRTLRLKDGSIIEDTQPRPKA